VHAHSQRLTHVAQSLLQVRRGSFDYFSTLSGIQVEEGTILVDACLAEAANVTDIYITDLDSSFRPPSSNYSGTSTIVGNAGYIASFVDPSKCSTSPYHRCSMYCEDTCLRSVTYTVNPASSENHTLEVCEVNSEVCVEIDGTYWYEMEDTETETTMQNTRSDRFRYYSVTLPNGTYTATFLDGNGTEAWPSFVGETYEDALCTDDVLQEGSVSLQIPSVDPLQCDELIRNGDAEASLTEPIYWLHRKGGIVLNTTDSRNGTNSFGDVERTDAGMDGISQYLDTRCLALRSGSLYEIKAWAKLINPATGVTYHCDENTESCPEVGFIAYSSPGVNAWSVEPAARTVSSASNRDYQLIHGLLDINEHMANANSALFYIERNKKNLAMLVDDVSMTVVPESGANRCDDLFYNSNFADGDTRFWTEYDSNRPFQIVSPGVGGPTDFALKTFDGSPQTYVKMGCLQLNERYALSAKFKMLDSNGAAFVCDNENPTGDTECPAMRLKPCDEENQGPTTTVAYTVGIPTAGGWNTMFGIFSADESYIAAKKIRFTLVSRQRFVMLNLRHQISHESLVFQTLCREMLPMTST